MYSEPSIVFDVNFHFIRFDISASKLHEHLLRASQFTSSITYQIKIKRSEPKENFLIAKNGSQWKKTIK